MVCLIDVKRRMRVFLPSVYSQAWQFGLVRWERALSIISTFLEFHPSLSLPQDSSPGTHKVHNCKQIRCRLKSRWIAIFRFTVMCPTVLGEMGFAASRTWVRPCRGSVGPANHNSWSLATCKAKRFVLLGSLGVHLIPGGFCWVAVEWDPEEGSAASEGEDDNTLHDSTIARVRIGL